ncbi:phage holin family protein [Roseicyclus sp. F158]|uniref:Phage holin family protein n=1 Tax=Tropicimonas omnivorans TaxID=3075590 RepID=A0ABU3DGS6_9RHOB|nr:phage holin family protein [Roseicyclus sp. F158]MDT0682769.1 phage holin family protein [Roseicyclus sp. F158]
MSTRPDPTAPPHEPVAEKGRGPIGLLSDAMNHVSNLLRNEMDLARAEISENVKRAAIAIGLLAAAGIIALVALNVLAAALVAALAETGLEPGWASLIVGVALAVIAFALVAKGSHDLKGTSLAPTRTSKNIKRDAEAVRDTYKENNHG